MLAAFETALRLLHPGHAVPHRRAVAAASPRASPTGRVSIALAGYPRYRARNLTDAQAEREIEIVQEIVTMARTLRAENKLDPKQRAARRAVFARPGAGNRRAATPSAIQKLANVNLEFRAEAAPKACRHALHRRIRPGPERSPIAAGRAAQAPGERHAISFNETSPTPERQLSDPVFLGKAPPQVVESIRQKLADYEEQLRKIEGALERRGMNRNDWASPSSSNAAALLEEDIGVGDVTSRACVPASRRASGRFLAREPWCVAGSPLLPLIYRCAAASNCVSQAERRPLRRWRDRAHGLRPRGIHCSNASAWR